jgi:predicted Zn-dependent protease
MTARMSLVMFGLLLSVCGCLSDDNKLPTVSSNPFSKLGGTRSASFKQAPPATQDIALRVDRVGKKIVTANARIQQKVAFLTLGMPHEEIFHQTHGDTSTVYITEGLAKLCKSDSELAAVLSQELGKIVSEETAQVQPKRSWQNSPPMMTPRVGNDISGGSFGSADGSEYLMKYHEEKWRQQTQQTLPTPPPPESLARVYLTGAGYDPKDLATVAPLLRKASKQNSLEQSMTGK